MHDTVDDVMSTICRIDNNAPPVTDANGRKTSTVREYGVYAMRSRKHSSSRAGGLGREGQDYGRAPLNGRMKSKQRKWYRYLLLMEGMEGSQAIGTREGTSNMVMKSNPKTACPEHS